MIYKHESASPFTCAWNLHSKKTFIISTLDSFDGYIYISSDIYMDIYMDIWMIYIYHLLLLSLNSEKINNETSRIQDLRLFSRMMTFKIVLLLLG